MLRKEKSKPIKHIEEALKGEDKALIEAKKQP
jgi:hypothetical protein